jgi:hypothetical protein
MTDIVNTQLVKDKRIGQITDQLTFGVYSGASQISQQKYQAITASPSQIVFNIQIPSQNTLLDKQVPITCRQTINVSYTNSSGGNIAYVDSNDLLALIGYGRYCSLAPYPFHQLINVAQANINSTSVSVNMADVLAAQLRLVNAHDLRAYNSTAPNMFDVYGNYNSSVDALNSIFANYSDSADTDLIGNGAWGIIDCTSSVASPIGNGITTVLSITFETTEHLMLSPFTWAHLPFHNGALYGLTNLNFNFTLLSNANRVWRTASSAPAGTYLQFNAAVPIVLDSTAFTNASVSMALTYMLGASTDILPSTNVSNYYELPRYLNQLPAGTLAPRQTIVVPSQSLQLSYIPDMVLIGVRKRTRLATDPDCWVSPTNISCNFNTVVGILSSTTRYQLYLMARDNGYNGTWYEFQGHANGSWSEPTGEIVTSGGFLVLRFGKDVNFPSAELAPGLLGNYVFQYNLTIENPNIVGGASINLSDYELVTIFMNSGVVSTTAGTTVTYTSLLTRQKVLDTKENQQESFSSDADIQRLVGGGFWDSIRSAVSSVLPIARSIGSVAKPLLGAMKDPRAQAASGVLGALGMGTSGGARHRSDKRL